VNEANRTNKTKTLPHDGARSSASVRPCCSKGGRPGRSQTRGRGFGSRAMMVEISGGARGDVGEGVAVVSSGELAPVMMTMPMLELKI
jgi:hypothetical protein